MAVLAIGDLKCSKRTSLYLQKNVFYMQENLLKLILDSLKKISSHPKTVPLLPLYIAKNDTLPIRFGRSVLCIFEANRVTFSLK